MAAPCPHGVDPEEYYKSIEGMAFACPFSHCACCGINFPYVETAMYSSQGYRGTFWTPKNRCGDCGGKYESFNTTGATIEA